MGERNRHLINGEWFRYLGYAGAGGLMQLAWERTKAIQNADPSKFPLGLASVNTVEELVEGAAPTVAGAFAGRAIYRLLLPGTGEPYNGRTETTFMAIGGCIGYGAMGILGAVLHYANGVSDVKWGPFK